MTRITEQFRSRLTANAEDFDGIVAQMLAIIEEQAAAIHGLTGRCWTKCSDRLPNPEEHRRVLIFTEGVDFDGEQFFDVEADWLNEHRFTDPNDQPETCAAATHWAPLLYPNDTEDWTRGWYRLVPKTFVEDSAA